MKEFLRLQNINNKIKYKNKRSGYHIENVVVVL